MKIKTYSELMQLKTFEERFEYLKLDGSVGEATFGHERYLNQAFYKSEEWMQIRDEVIARDNGCDLGCRDREIPYGIVVHHINPIQVYDICEATEYLMNPEYLICVSKMTHNAIHYGNKDLLMKDPVERKPNDTCPWKR